MIPSKQMDSPIHRKRPTPHDFDSPSVLNKSSPGKIESSQKEVDDFFENFQQQIHVQFVNLQENLTDCGVQAKQCLEHIFAMEELKKQQLQPQGIKRGLSLQQEHLHHQNQQSQEQNSKYYSEKNNICLIAPSSLYQKDLIKLNPVEQAPLLPSIVHRFRAKTINQNNNINNTIKETQEQIITENDNTMLKQRYDCSLEDNNNNNILTTRDHKLQRQRILSLQAHPSANMLPSVQKQILQHQIKKNCIKEEGSFPIIPDNTYQNIQATQLKWQQEKMNKLQRQQTQQPSPPSSLNSGLNQLLPSQASNYSVSRHPVPSLRTASTFDESSTFNQTESLSSNLKLQPDQIHSKNQLKFQQLSEQSLPCLAIDHHQPIKKKIIKISKESAFSKIIDQDFSSFSSRIPYLSPTQASNPSQDKQFNIITQDSMQPGSAQQDFKILKIIKKVESKKQQPCIVKQLSNNQQLNKKLSGMIKYFDEDKENKEDNYSNSQSSYSAAIQEKTCIEKQNCKLNTNINSFENRVISGGQNSEKSLFDKQQVDRQPYFSNNPVIQGNKGINSDFNNNLYDIDPLSQLAESLNRKKIRPQGPLSFANSRLPQPGGFVLDKDNQIKLQLNKSRLNNNINSSSFVASRSCLQNLVIQDIDDFKIKFKI